MALQNVKADGNVPFIAGRSRYQLIGLDPAWIFHKMAAGVTFDKKMARTTLLTSPELDPSIENGSASFLELSEGGVFDTVATAKKSMVIEDLLNGGGATLDIVALKDLKAAQDGAGIETAPKFRDIPASFPFTLAPGETIRAFGGATGSIVGIYIRENAGALR